ncbi:MAG TPA: alpha-amylase family glycosyl hydrolase [Terriglobales bacterium]
MASQGFDWIWFLGVWQTGLAGLKLSREQPAIRFELRETLPDCTDKDICGSCFAIIGYTAHADFGGNAALERVRQRLHQRGMRLLLDFIPNHTALDHPWGQGEPGFYVPGTDDQLRREPQNYIHVETNKGRLVLAHGRDPYFPGWTDTLQLNYAELAVQKAMLAELQRVAAACDGVRCDMSMLILPEVFEKTWGKRPDSFWPKAIQAVRSSQPDFLFMAEVYWDLEWTLQQQGFDYTYDKRLYDRLREGHAGPVRDHFRADPQFQRKSARFLENHDEPRAAAAFPPAIYPAAAVLTYLCQGLRFFHDGQFEGRTKRIPMQVDRGATEPVQPAMVDFYNRLLECVNSPVARNGSWRLLECSPAWDGNWTADCFICFSWEMPDQAPLIIAVNYAPNQSQCYVKMQLDQFRARTIRLEDQLHSITYERNGDELLSRGLYLDMPPWGCHVFACKPLDASSKAK